VGVAVAASLVLVELLAVGLAKTAVDSASDHPETAADSVPDSPEPAADHPETAADSAPVG